METHFFDRAIRNIVAFGDTDIFPFPIENHIMFDVPERFKRLLIDLDNRFDALLYEYPPAKANAIVPVGYTGFRWVAQIDPLWNAYLLALTLSLADDIEKERTPTSRNVVHSYRYKWDETSSEIFSRDFSWRTFQVTSRDLAESAKYVVACDISEFYGRVNHHRLENALQHLDMELDNRPKS